MKSLKPFVLMLCVAALSACVNAPKTLAFSGSDRDALLIMASEPDNMIQTHVFRRVDLERKAFIGEPVRVVTNNFRGMEMLFAGLYQNQINADNSKRAISLSVERVPPGNYVHTEIYNDSSWKIGWVCFGGDMPVYELAAGQASVVRADETSKRASKPSNDDIIGEYRRAASNFTGIAADAKMPVPVAVINWTATKGGFGEWLSSRQCIEPASFALVARQP